MTITGIQKWKLLVSGQELTITKKETLRLLNLHGNLNIWETETERSGIQGCPRLHNEFEAILDYMRSCLKTTKNQSNATNNLNLQVYQVW